MPAAMSQTRIAVLPESVEAARGDIGQVERRRTQAADAGDFAHDIAQFDEIIAVLAAAEMRHAGADDAVGQLLAAGDAQAAVVEERAAAALGGVELVHGRDCR